MDKSQDDIYIKKVQDGDAEAFRFLVDKYKAMAYTLSLQVVRQPEIAEELTQDAFLKAYKALPRFKGDSRFSTWLYRIVYNTAISFKRKKTRYTLPLETEVTDAEDKTIDPMEALTRNEAMHFLEQALDLLDEETRFLLTLYYLEEQSVKELSKVIKQTESNVKVRLFRGRKKLYEILSALLQHEVDSLRLS